MTAAAPTALYRIFGAEDVLLYIGVSNNFGRRWNEHARKQAWWNERRRMTVTWYDSRDEALDAEALAIFTEQPKHNVLHRKQALRLKRLKAVTKAQPERHCVKAQPAASKGTTGQARWEDPR